MKMERDSLILSTMIVLLILVFLIPPAFSHHGRQSKLPDGSLVVDMSNSGRPWNDSNKKGLGTAIINPKTGLPRFISGFKTKPLGKDGEGAAKEFLKGHSDFLKIDPSTLSMVKEKEANGTKHVKFQQMYKDVPVDMSAILVHMTPEGEIVGFSSNYLPDLDLDVTPKITANDALSVVMKDLGIDIIKDDSTAGIEIQPLSPSVFSQEGPCASYALLGMENPHKPTLLGPELVIYSEVIYSENEGEKKAHLAWKISYSGKDVGSWRYFVDAHTGEIISIQDPRQYYYYTNGYYYSEYYANDDTGDDLSTAPLVNGGVTAWHYWNGWVQDSFDIADDIGYYIVTYPEGYLWYRRMYHLAGPKCWVVDARTYYDAYYYVMYKTQIPTNPPPFIWNQDPDNINSLFDSQNVNWHINNSIRYYYNTVLDADLGSDIKCWTHVYRPGYTSWHDSTTGEISFTTGTIYYNNPSWAADNIRHELQHAFTQKIYDPYVLYNNHQEKVLNEAMSDYFAATQLNDPELLDWMAIYPEDIRDLGIRRNMSQWTETEVYLDSMIYSSALWEIRNDLDFDYHTIDQLAFGHLFWEPKTIGEACINFCDEAFSQNFDTADLWEFLYVFARHGITHYPFVETFTDGEADGWETLSGLWHVSLYKWATTPYSLAYNKTPPTPPDYDVGHSSGDAIVKIENLDEFDYAELQFHIWCDIECLPPCPLDILTVSISTDGEDWKTIFDSSNPALWPAGFTMGQWWTFWYIFLPAERVPELHLKFSFDSVTAANNFGEGWYIDNIRVYVDDDDIF